MESEREKLLRLRGEIEALLKREDVGAYMILHLPGIAEQFAFLEPSYSKIKTVRHGTGMSVALKSSLAEYGGDKEAQRRDLEATANMLGLFVDIMYEGLMGLLQLSEWTDRKLGAKHSRLTRLNFPNGEPSSPPEGTH